MVNNNKSINSLAFCLKLKDMECYCLFVLGFLSQGGERRIESRDS